MNRFLSILSTPGLRTGLGAAGLFLTMAVGAAEDPLGKKTYDSACAACHASGIAGAPKVGDAAAWAPRIKTGIDALVNSALKGKGAMPAKGGQTALPDAAVRAAVVHMTQLSSTAAAAAAPAAAAPPAAAAASAPAVVATANTFNRLMRAPGRRNLPPAEDLIHDPTNDGTLQLQPPLAAFEVLPRSNAGNRVNWVKAIGESHIQPRADRLDPKVAPMVMDLNIVREVKGSMPDVVYPHKQHTEWLDCSNCHPAIFIPQKGANQISMASILLGQQCGVCHGKVAFPVSECRLCHSKPKPTPAVASASSPAK
ncbi:c(7)-type cytochrome triheme domain-containing protein [Ideonella sp. A 288]|uniref:c(7)-type cytochrome triheme domain-containing protein n=1 Tax=Ideonella sp. A 288 TaxID=1962181 RepID=UPI001F226B23|nr:c(7)-type cytochrome triheme domain-containing protein [Ideonella sp. A 288]